MTEELVRRPVRRFAAAVATAGAGLLVLAGCAAGQDAGTINQRPAIDGASANAGQLAVRTAVIVSSGGNGAYAQGGDALLQLVIINNGPAARQLQAVSSPIAGGVVLSKAGVPGTDQSAQSDVSSSAEATTAGTASPSTTGSASAGASASATGSESAGAGASPASSPEAAQSTPIDIGAGQTVQIGYSAVGPNIVLTGLTAALYPAQTVPVTFTFSDGTSITTQLSVQLNSDAPSAPVVSEATEPAQGNG